MSKFRDNLLLINNSKQLILWRIKRPFLIEPISDNTHFHFSVKSKQKDILVDFHGFKYFTTINRFFRFCDDIIFVGNKNIFAFSIALIVFIIATLCTTTTIFLHSIIGQESETDVFKRSHSEANLSTEETEFYQSNNDNSIDKSFTKKNSTLTDDNRIHNNTKSRNSKFEIDPMRCTKISDKSDSVSQKQKGLSTSLRDSWYVCR